MELIIYPYVGVGPIQFGMTPHQVRNALGETVSQFKKTTTSESYTDSFDNLGIHIYYGKNGLCEAIEFGGPSKPIFMGQELIGIPFNQVRHIFETVDDLIEINDDGLTSLFNGVGVFVPTLKRSNKEPVEGVIVFEQGYYDK